MHPTQDSKHNSSIFNMLYSMPTSRKTNQDLTGVTGSGMSGGIPTSVFNSQRADKDISGLSPYDASSKVYGSKPQSTFIPSAGGTGGLTPTGFQGLSHLSGSATRGIANPTFSRANTAPSGYTNLNTGMGPLGAVAGQFGAPSPPPSRNTTMFMNHAQPPNQGAFAASKTHQPRPNTLALAISSGVPMNSYSALTNNRVSHMSPFSSTYNNSLLEGAGGTGQNLDPSEFPVLTRAHHDSVSIASAVRAGYGSFTDQFGGRVYGTTHTLPAGQLNKQTETTQEFQMRYEDFPSLPGSSAKTTESSEASNNNQDGSSTSAASGVTVDGRTSLSYDPAPGANKERSLSSSAIGAPKAPARKASQNVNVSPGMVQDHYGMLGLLTFIRGAETDPNLVALALGSDLTTLGLNLNSPESLYSTFSSPFSDSPSRPQDIDYAVPQEYLIHSYIRDKLAPIRLSKYNEDLLFYLYYTSGGDLLQLLSAHELYSRDWRFHKEGRIWITRAPGIKPSKIESTFEEGTYCFFDLGTWRKAHKEMKVEYDKLAERPQIPPAFTQQILSTVPMNQ